MKLLPALPPVFAGNQLPLQPSTMDLKPQTTWPLTFNPSELLWRYPIGLPSSPLMDFKTHLPNNLATDPRIWSRDDVVSFLRWCEREFDLQPFDMEMFQMNGKAMCLLTRNDLAERCPGAGDVLHNVLQLLVRDASLLQRCLPSSPVTPTSRHAYPLSPHSHPPTPNWNILSQGATADHFQNAAHAASLAHFINQGNSVTLSPAPSVDSQSGSPQHADNNSNPPQLPPIFVPKTEWTYNGNGSNHSDSDEDSYHENSPQNGHHTESPPNTPNLLAPPPLRSPKKEALTPSSFRPAPTAAREFFPSDAPPEPNTNGRLLWDFLQQLLNDPSQRYTNYITWKNRETGVFKIADPAGLAKLWGIQKNHLSMNYDKMSRALRYYYRVNILRKVQGERHCYQFLRNPSELKNIKNISLLRQQMSPTQQQQNQQSVHQQNQQAATQNGSMMLIKNEQQNLKNITALRQQMSPNNHQQSIAITNQLNSTNSAILNSKTNEQKQTELKNLSLMRPSLVQNNSQVTMSLKTSPEITIKMEEHHHSPPLSHHHQMDTSSSSSTSSTSNQRHKVNTPMDDEDMPTDLSMIHPTDLSSKSDKHRISVLCASEINRDSTAYSNKMAVSDK
ncbi:ets DNA-binding protein pokkuri isoform X2 [Chrysoperla carnea]|nr:ets DNA-binding protein pokkuri isoform X2 [Chrysoperla carnea]XP_044737328.1 ets DNA-binding protein pokkuri isoform X2 [Chrysoperla carnea]